MVHFQKRKLVVIIFIRKKTIRALIIFWQPSLTSMQVTELVMEMTSQSWAAERARLVRDNITSNQVTRMVSFCKSRYRIQVGHIWQLINLLIVGCLFKVSTLTIKS